MHCDKKIEGKIQSHEIAQEYAKQEGMNTIAALSLLSWYFKEDSSQKSFDIKVFDAYVEVIILHNSFSDQLTAQIAKQFPNLYAYIMEGQRSRANFRLYLVSVIARIPLLNYAAVQKEIEEKYPHHLTWAQDDERYETIIAGIRAAQVIEAIDLDKYTRYMTSFQNRIFNGIHGLAVIDQYEAKTVQALANSASLDLTGDEGNQEETSTDSD